MAISLSFFQLMEEGYVTSKARISKSEANHGMLKKAASGVLAVLTRGAYASYVSANAAGGPPTRLRTGFFQHSHSSIRCGQFPHVLWEGFLGSAVAASE